MIRLFKHKLIECDPAKNKTCTKEHCFINGGPCHQTTKKECIMENEIRYYLKTIKDAMDPEANEEGAKLFKPTYIITAVKLPTGAIELAVNTDNIADKIDYILDAYDEDMCLKTNKDICMQNIMIV